LVGEETEATKKEKEKASKLIEATVSLYTLLIREM